MTANDDDKPKGKIWMVSYIDGRFYVGLVADPYGTEEDLVFWTESDNPDEKDFGLLLKFHEALTLIFLLSRAVLALMEERGALWTEERFKELAKVIASNDYDINELRELVVFRMLPPVGKIDNK